MVSGPKVEMKENPGRKMQSYQELQWTGTRRPQTAVWRVPKSDTRRENYSKSAQDRGPNYDSQSPTYSWSPASSIESGVSSQVIDLHVYNGTSHGSCANSNSAPSTDRKLPHIYNIPERSHLYLDGGTPNTQTYLTSVEIKTPWYIGVLYEKERCLLKLGEEINRLSRYEVESKRKDQIISSLRSEVSQLQSDVHRSVLTGREEDKSSMGPSDLPTSHIQEEFLPYEEFPAEVTKGKSPSGPSPKDPSSERRESAASTEERLSAKQRKSQITEDKSSMGPSDLPTSHIQEEFLPYEEFPTEVTEGKSPSGPSPKDPSSERRESSASTEERLSAKQRKSQITEILVDDIAAEDGGRPEDEELSPVSIDQPEDKDQLIQKLQEDIETLRKDHQISKGVISSLQKSISSHESKLRKSTSEKEELQREVREREIQIRAMSRKFSSLREERKHEELMATMEQENRGLREMMGEVKGEVTRRNEMIAELRSEVQRLQKEISKCQAEVRKREEERSHLQGRAEDLASSEQHIRVALETTQTRFERFRSKIIQAAYTAPGLRGPQVEISDHEILESMQKIITDRSDFHQQLKQKGVKIPPLHVSETSASAAKQSSSPSRKKAP